jgi:hypothetical protein
VIHCDFSVPSASNDSDAFSLPFPALYISSLSPRNTSDCLKTDKIGFREPSFAHEMRIAFPDLKSRGGSPLCRCSVSPNEMKLLIELIVLVVCSRLHNESVKCIQIHYGVANKRPTKLIQSTVSFHFISFGLTEHRQSGELPRDFRSRKAILISYAKEGSRKSLLSVFRQSEVLRGESKEMESAGKGRLKASESFEADRTE